MVRIPTFSEHGNPISGRLLSKGVNVKYPPWTHVETLYCGMEMSTNLQELN